MRPCIIILEGLLHGGMYYPSCPLVEENVVLGFPFIKNKDIVLNCLECQIPYIFLYKKKQKPISIVDSMSILKQRLILEEIISMSNDNSHKFETICGDLWDHQ